MNVIPDADWQQLLPRIRERCPRLTPLDFAEAQQRVDLLAAKIQNRHWCSRSQAQSLVLSLLKQQGVIAAT